jgi:Na+-transporting NADH:ubiquinone oxidoreductase subunit D
MKKFLLRLNYTKWFNVLRDGIARNNPIVVTVLGICSSLAVANMVENALAMGLGVTFVTMLSSAFISLIRNYIPSQVRMVTYMVIISSFTIVFEMILQAYAPEIAERLGAYVGLIITNCIVMGRAEAFAVKNPVRYSTIDAFASGLGYTIVLLMMSVIREAFSQGTIFNIQVMPSDFVNWIIFAIAPGGFFVIALFVWFIRDRQQFVEGAE